ncbi:MAG: tetratricopeptide repeat protein, partial [Pontibacterium sp.]
RSITLNVDCEVWNVPSVECTPKQRFEVAYDTTVFNYFYKDRHAVDIALSEMLSDALLESHFAIVAIQQLAKAQALAKQLVSNSQGKEKEAWHKKQLLLGLKQIAIKDHYAIFEIADLEEYVELSAQLDRWLVDQPQDNIELLTYQYKTYRHLAHLYAGQNQFESALRLFRRANDVQHALASNHPQQEQYKSALLKSTYHIGWSLLNLENPDDAVTVFTQALAMYEQSSHDLKKLLDSRDVALRTSVSLAFIHEVKEDINLAQEALGTAEKWLAVFSDDELTRAQLTHIPPLIEKIRG